MTILQALVLGVVQGLSEFLPISSSAHLTLVPWLLGWPDPGLAVDVALHVGTLLAVLWYFRREWVRLAHAALELARHGQPRTVEERRVLLLIIGTIPGAVAGKLLEHQAETAFRDPLLVAAALVVAGLLLWAADRLPAQSRQLPDLRVRDAIWIGLAQACAIIPGVSRSGSTITAGRALRLTREDAAVFSFLLSMPIIAGAALLEVPHAVQETHLSAALLIGVLASGISGWLAIGALLRIVTRHSYGWFAAYRVVVGAIVVAVALARA